jgi:ribosomal protein L30E
MVAWKKIPLRQLANQAVQDAGAGRVVIGAKKTGKIIKHRKHKGIVRGKGMRVNNQFILKKVL